MRSGGSADEAYRRLRDLIVTGRLSVGVQIIERRAAERLDVSRSAVRKALQRLVQQGYVIFERTGKYSRAVVAPLTIDDMEEAYAIVGALDGVAAGRAAELPEEERRTLVGQLRAVNDQLLEASRQAPPDFAAVYELDEELHRLYIDRAGGARLLAHYEAVRPRTERYGRVYASALVDRITESVAEHNEIADAIEDGAREGARAAADANWRHAVERFREVMTEKGEREFW